jgi:hypothetical protein
VFNPPYTEQIQAVVIFIYKITILGDKGRVYFFNKGLQIGPIKSEEVHRWGEKNRARQRRGTLAFLHNSSKQPSWESLLSLTTDTTDPTHQTFKKTAIT